MTDNKEPVGIIALNKKHEKWLQEKDRIQKHIEILEDSLMIERAFLEFLTRDIEAIEKA